MNQPSLFGSNQRTARDQSLKQVAANAGITWKDHATDVVLLFRGQLMTGEDIRLECHKRNIAPHHPNAWGGFVMGLVRSKVLLPTDRYVAMRAKGSHARKTQVYKVA